MKNFRMRFKSFYLYLIGAVIAVVFFVYELFDQSGHGRGHLPYGKIFREAGRTFQGAQLAVKIHEHGSPRDWVRRRSNFLWQVGQLPKGFRRPRARHAGADDDDLL